MDLSRAAWRTSSYTQPNNNNCVEVGPAASVIGLRDTKAREYGAISVQRATFAALISAIQRDQFKI